MRIGVVILFESVVNRANMKVIFNKNYFLGFKQVISELKYNYEIISLSQIENYDYALISLTGTHDLINLVHQYDTFFPNGHKCCKIVIGGGGISNFKILSDIVDVVVLGRAEGQINEILEGDKHLENVWRKENDPEIRNEYLVRQPQYLCEKETAYGCAKKCYFCQYTWTRKHQGLSDSYNSTTNARISHEDFLPEMKNVINTPGNYTTGVDGLSEETRFRINKRITDNDIIELIESLHQKNFDKTVRLKMFQIVGYPWENIVKIKSDLYKFIRLISSLDHKSKMKLNLFLMCQIFTPRALTPFQYMGVDLNIDYKDILLKNGSKKYIGENIKIYLQPFIPSNKSVLLQLLQDRGFPEDIKILRILTQNKNLQKLKTNDQVRLLLDRDLIPGYIYKPLYNKISFSNIKTYVDLDKMASKLRDMYYKPQNN